MWRFFIQIQQLSWAVEESDIPIAIRPETSISSPANESMHRWLLIVLLILGALSVLWLLLKKAQKLSVRKTSPLQIKIINNLPLGGKKYLSIVQVAGETILIGVTEHHISHIKNLALLDEDELQSFDSIQSKLIKEQSNQIVSEEAIESPIEVVNMSQLVKDKIKLMKPL